MALSYPPAMCPKIKILNDDIRGADIYTLQACLIAKAFDPPVLLTYRALDPTSNIAYRLLINSVVSQDGSSNFRYTTLAAGR